MAGDSSKKVFLDTMEKPSQGAIVAKEMYNTEYDIVGQAKNQQPNIPDGRGGMKTFTRPGVVEGQEIHMTDMTMDNWRTACGGDPAKIKILNKFGYDNVVTEGVDGKLAPFFSSVQQDPNNPQIHTVNIYKGDAWFNYILKNTPQGQKTEQFFTQNAGELGPNEISRLDVTETPGELIENVDNRYDLMLYTPKW